MFKVVLGDTGLDIVERLGTTHVRYENIQSPATAATSRSSTSA